jgi:hypothetical protein
VRIVAGLGDGDSSQLLTVPRGHQPHDGGRQRVEVTVLMTLLAVARAEPGWPQPDRHHRSAAVLVAAQSAGALVAVGPPPLRLPWLEWRPRGGSTRSGSGVAPPRSSPRPPPRGLPGQPGANRAPLGIAADHKSSYARIRPPLPPGGWPWAGPLGPASLGPSSEGITRAGKTRAMRIERPPWQQASAP